MVHTQDAHNQAYHTHTRVRVYTNLTSGLKFKHLDLKEFEVLKKKITLVQGGEGGERERCILALGLGCGEKCSLLAALG